MKPNEIRSEMIRKEVTVTSIAKKLGIKQPAVSQVIYGVRRNPRIREAIANAIEKPVSALWPGQVDEGTSTPCVKGTG